MSSFSRLFVLPLIVASAAFVGCARVVIDDPDNGEFVNDTVVNVTGNVFSTKPEERPIVVADLLLEINGANVALAPDGTYSTSIVLDPNAVFNAIETDLTEISTGWVDSDRIVIVVGDSVAEGDYSPEAIALQINASGLEALEPVVSGLVNIDLPTLMPVGTNVVQDLCVIDGGFLGCLGRATISITAPEPSISGFSVDFSPQQNSVHAVITLSDFDLNVYLDGGSYVLVPNCDLNLMASTVTLAGDYTLEPDATNPNKVDVAQLGGISTMFVNFDQTFTSGACDTFLVGDIIQLIIGDVEPLVIGGLEGFLNSVDGNGNTPIAAAIEGALAGVDISGPAGQALNTELDAPFFQVQETTTGITLGSDARFVTNIGTGLGECDPPAGAPDLTASYHVAQTFPSFGTNSPNGTPYDIGLGISSSGFNQLLRSMIECGLLIATVTEIDLASTGTPQALTSGLLAPFIPFLANLPPDFPARLEIRPTIAPLITGAPGPGGELALLKIAQLNMSAIVTDPEGTDIEAADLMLDADVGIDLSFDPATGTLVFVLAEPDPSFITAKAIENPFGSDLSAVEALLPHVVGTFLPALAGGLGSFPLPSFLGLSLDVVQVARNGEMLTIYANLE
ncbi:MAG: hypothetical protein ACI9JM_002822 [Halioglobus sp.]|jgi:hypothetical protein